MTDGMDPMGVRPSVVTGALLASGVIVLTLDALGI